MDEDNGVETIAEGLRLIGQRLNVTIRDIALKLAVLLDPICKAIMQLQNNKQRLPRKIKKKYKKLGIYEQWKEDNL